jgi:hypothetical protein
LSRQARDTVTPFLDDLTGSVSRIFCAPGWRIHTVGVFTTREIAVAVWAIAALFATLTIKSARRSFIGLIRAASNWKLLLSAALLAGYTALFVRGLFILDVWESELLKDTILWFLFSGMALAFSAMSGAKQGGFWRKAAQRQLKSLLAVEYVVSASTFPLPVELLFIPACAVLIAFDTVAKRKREFKRVARITSAVIAIISLAVIGFALRDVRYLFSDTQLPHTLRGAALAPILSLACLPFAYLLALTALFEELVGRMSFGPTRDHALARYAARRVFLHCRLRPVQIQEFSKKYVVELMNLSAKADVTRLLVPATNGLPGKAQEEE